MIKTTTNKPGAAGIREETSSRSVSFAIVSLSLSMLMPSLDTSIANIALPTIANALNTTFEGVQWIILAYLLVITTLIVIAGRLGDITGRRRLLLSGIAIFTAASFLCGIAPNISLLIAARAMQGAGAAIMIALTLAVAGDTVKNRKIGSAMGLLGSMSAIGTTFGPALGGLLMTLFSWRSLFLINVPIGFLNFFLAKKYLPEDRRGAAKDVLSGLDLPGTAIFALTVASYALAVTRTKESGSLKVILLLAAVGGFISFIYYERRAKAPLIELKVFRDPAISAGLTANSLVSAVMMSTLVIGPFYLSKGLGLNTAAVGVLLSVGPLFAAIGGIPAGLIADRFDPARITMIGLAGILTGSALLAVLPVSFGAAGYVAAIVVITTSYAVFQASNNTFMIGNAGPQKRGVISGMLTLSRNLGLITGASFIGAVFIYAAGINDLSAAAAGSVSRGMRSAFAAAALLMTIALVANISAHVLRKRGRSAAVSAEPA
ncbi:MAG: MFS transporter [Pyrinomonadaceae bacterium]